MLVNSCLNHPDTTLTEMRLPQISIGYLRGPLFSPIAILINTRNLLGCDSWIPGSRKKSRNDIEFRCEVKQRLRKRNRFVLVVRAVPCHESYL